jgi:hypothetical protein
MCIFVFLYHWHTIGKKDANKPNGKAWQKLAKADENHSLVYHGVSFDQSCSPFSKFL